MIESAADLARCRRLPLQHHHPPHIITSSDHVVMRTRPLERCDAQIISLNGKEVALRLLPEG